VVLTDTGGKGMVTCSALHLAYSYFIIDCVLGNLTVILSLSSFLFLLN